MNIQTTAPIICQNVSMPPDLYALVCDYLVEFLPKEKQPEKVIKVTPEDGKFSDDEETENVPKTISKADRRPVYQQLL